MHVTTPEGSDSMGPTRQRRSHKKSRNGCKACKARRTKCDEQGPPCVNCVIRKTECFYPKHVQTTENICNRALSTSPPLGTSTREPQNVLELELLAQWTTNTAISLGGGLEDQDRWRLKVTQEALKFEPLLDAILAVSAAHIAENLQLMHPSRSRYVNASLEYYGRCCGKFRNELINIAPETYKAVLYCSLALTVLRLYIPQYGADEESCIHRVLAIFEMLQGTWSIINIMNSNREGSLNAQALSQRFQSKPLHEDVALALLRLRYLSQSTVELEPLEWQCCNEAIDLLEHWWTKAHLKDHGVALIWLLTVPRDFVRLIEIGNATAHLILLHWAVLFETVSGTKKWWSRTIGSKLTLELSAELESIASGDPAWIEAILWARQTVVNEGMQF